MKTVVVALLLAGCAAALSEDVLDVTHWSTAHRLAVCLALRYQATFRLGVNACPPIEPGPPSSPALRTR